MTAVDPVALNPLLEGLEQERRAPPGVLVVFGASGDLTARKLVPAIQRLANQRQLPTAFAVVGVARTEWNDDDFRNHVSSAVESDSPVWQSLIRNFRYVAGDYNDDSTFEDLRNVLDELDKERGTSGNRTYYLATVPSVFEPIISRLGKFGLHTRQDETSQIRIVIEKPYGHDLASAKALDRIVHDVFDESQVYRIDHYLGKETVQNVLALRFGNAIFEPVWNRRYIDNVQITVSESLGVGHRGGFYENAGAMRDIVQNHVLQVLALIGMEPPARFDARGIRDEKVKVLRAIETFTPESVAENVVRGQYDAGWVDGEAVPGYREEEGVAPDSRTETYVAMGLKIDNWRWAGVPFLVRTGKRLPKRVTEVGLKFKAVPHLPFLGLNSQLHERNSLVLRIQPDEGITLRFAAKVPGQAFKMRTVKMDFSYGAEFLEETPDAYERLLLDAMVGDPTLFIRTDEVEEAWRIVDPILETWAADPDYPLARYKVGTWGPTEADDLVMREDPRRRWRNP